MKTNSIQVDKLFNNFEWAGINLMWGAWTWAMMSEAITWILGVIGALTLIWFNVERALKARKERGLLEKPNKTRKYAKKEDAE
jgi:hypothetical protein